MGSFRDCCYYCTTASSRLAEATVGERWIGILTLSTLNTPQASIWPLRAACMQMNLSNRRDTRVSELPVYVVSEVSSTAVKDRTA